MQQDLAALYAALGLPVGAPLEQIEQAHRDLVNVWHPDRFAQNPRLQRKAEEKLKEINAAHDALRSVFERMGDQPPFTTATGAKPADAKAAGNGFRTAEPTDEPVGEANDDSQPPLAEPVDNSQPPSPRTASPKRWSGVIISCIAALFASICVQNLMSNSGADSQAQSNAVAPNTVVSNTPAPQNDAVDDGQSLMAPVWSPEGELVFIRASDFNWSAVYHGYRRAMEEEVRAALSKKEYRRLSRRLVFRAPWPSAGLQIGVPEGATEEDFLAAQMEEKYRRLYQRLVAQAPAVCARCIVPIVDPSGQVKLGIAIDLKHYIAQGYRLATAEESLAAFAKQPKKEYRSSVRQMVQDWEKYGGSVLAR